MRIFLLLVFTSSVAVSFSQSKKEIIDELTLDQKLKSATIDSLKIVNQQLKRSLKNERETSKEYKTQVTKMNFETADLRLVMYEHVASIDSLNRVLEDRENQYEMMKQNYNQCKKDKENLVNSMRSYPQEVTNNESNDEKGSIDGPRTIVNKLNIERFNSKEKATFRFLLTVNELGIVTDVEMIAKNCSDTNLQESVIEEIKRQVRYNPVPGSGIIRIKYSCSINPT